MASPAPRLHLRGGIFDMDGVVVDSEPLSSVASWVPQVAVLVALGVGVDYALFVVSRHRNGLLAGQAPEDAAVTALNTSGRAVLLAGLTVRVALLGLFALQVSFLYGVAVTVTLVVGLTMAASLTLLPAMLGFLGPNVLRRAERRRLAQHGRQVEQAGGLWLHWAEGLGRRPQIPAVLALAVITVLAIPFLFAILFGLSTDYEVFLVSRMHEEWTLTGDNKRAVIRGQAETGRVITAASLIMILVFAAFILAGEEAIMQMGLGFAAAIFLDAYIIRTVLVPATMHALGRANWWLPARLDRALPRLNVEPAEPTLVTNPSPSR